MREAAEALPVYSKVLLLDSDMIVRKNVDDVFELKTPAAMRREDKKLDPPGADADHSAYGRDSGHVETFPLASSAPEPFSLRNPALGGYTVEGSE